jgi:hypothetical protein
MRTLSIEQKEHLENHIAKKPIEYIELYNELYDHYASAYEDGEENLEETIERLDDHFHYQKVKRINDNLLKKTKKSVNEIYWTEFKNFWRWPQIVSTIAIVFFGIMLFEYLPMKIILWYVLLPILFFLIALLIYGSIVIRRKKYGNKKFKSAYLTSTHHFLSLPISLFNLSIFLPALFLEPYKPRIEFYESHPLVPFILVMLFLIAAYIGFKVVRRKIRIQYL